MKSTTLWQKKKIKKILRKAMAWRVGRDGFREQFVLTEYMSLFTKHPDDNQKWIAETRKNKNRRQSYPANNLQQRIFLPQQRK